MMNGDTAITFRRYAAACDRLKAIYCQLETADSRAVVLDKLSIWIPRFNGDGPTIEVVGKAMAEAMKADAHKYLDGLIERAQADALDAANALRNAIGIDLDSRYMKKAKSK